MRLAPAVASSKLSWCRFPSGRAYPYPSEGPEKATHEAVQEFLGPTNNRLIAEAKSAFVAGDAAAIGRLLVIFSSLCYLLLLPLLVLLLLLLLLMFRVSN